MDHLRQMLRFQGLRCHLMYCRNSTRLQIIPLLASRSQALRYCISILSSVYMFVSFIMLLIIVITRTVIIITIGTAFTIFFIAITKIIINRNNSNMRISKNIVDFDILGICSYAGV